MQFRIGSVLAALALVVSMAATVALAQSDNDPSLGDAVPADTSIAEPAPQPSVAPTLFLTLASPVEHDLEVPLGTAQLTIRGTTLPGAVVSIDGDLVDTDDQGNFGGVASLVAPALAADQPASTTAATPDAIGPHTHQIHGVVKGTPASGATSFVVTTERDGLVLAVPRQRVLGGQRPRR